MATAEIRAALERVESVLQRRPGLGLHADTEAIACWNKEVSAITRHPNGTEILTDMPPEFGGRGAAVTPGWLMRAGLAACTVTCIALAAAAQGIELDAVEVTAQSHSDARGVLGMEEPDATRVPAAPRAVQLRVRIGARGVSAERLRQLVEDTRRCSPVLCALEDAVPVSLQVEVTPA